MISYFASGYFTRVRLIANAAELEDARNISAMYVSMVIIGLSLFPHMLLYLAGQPGVLPQAQIADRDAHDSNEALLDYDEEVRGAGAEAIRASDRLEMVRSLLVSTRTRVLREISALARRGNLNLSIGIFTTVAAIGLLANIVLTAQIDYKSTPSVLGYYIPRITFVAFIEIFSFFFLRLYKSSLDGIKYFQNELTNIEMRFISIEIALLGETSTALASVLVDLAKTERNFILKKGEATVEIRKVELESESHKQTLTAVSDILKAIKLGR